MKKAPKRSRLPKRTSLISIVFAITAVAYIGYRLFSIAGPTGFASLINQSDRTVNIGCTEHIDQEVLVSDQMPYIGASHQTYLYSLPSKSANLVSNASLDNTDKASGSPTGFAWNKDADYLAYTYERDPETRIPHLRVTTKQKITADQTPGSWLPQPIPIEADTTYVYSLSYRSTTQLTAGVEYTMPDGSLVYEPVTTVDGSRDWQRFTHYVHNTRGAKAFRFMLNSREAGTIDTRDYDAHRVAGAALPKGMVSVAFDDGWQSVATHAMPLLEKYNVPTTQYVITEASDKSVSEYMNIETLQGIKQKGHEIGSHSRAHCNQTEQENQEILADATESKALLERKNLGPIASYAYPYGAYDGNTQPLVGRAYSYIRTTDEGYNDRYFDTHRIRSMVVTNTTDTQTLQHWLDTAARHKLWVVITYHRINEKGRFNISSQQFEEHLRLITRSGLDIQPVTTTAKTIR